MSAKVDESSPYVTGSEKGLAYMREYAGVPKGFISFLQEAQVKTAGNRTSSLISTAMVHNPIFNNLTSTKTAIGISETNRFSTEKENEVVRKRGEQVGSQYSLDRSTVTKRASMDKTSLEAPEICLQKPAAEPRPDGEGERGPDIETVSNIDNSTINGRYQDRNCESAQANSYVNILKNSSDPKPDSGQREDTGSGCKGITNHTHSSAEEMVMTDNVVSGFPANRELEDADIDSTINIPNSQSVCFPSYRNADNKYNCSYSSGKEHIYLDYNDSRMNVREEEKLSGEETGCVTDKQTVKTTKEQLNERDQSDRRGAVPVSSVPSLFVVSTHNQGLSESGREIRRKDPNIRKTAGQKVNIPGTETGHNSDFPDTFEKKSADFQPTLPKPASTKNSFTCPKCHNTFKFRRQLNKHHCLAVAKEGLSGKQTFSRKNKKKNINLKRSKLTKEGKYKCHYCEKRFQAKSHMNVHEASTHTKKYMYKCSLSSEKFVQRSKFPNHKKAYEAKYPGKTCKFDKLNTTREKDKKTICKGLKSRGNNYNAPVDGCSIQQENKSYREKDVLNVMSEKQKSMLESIKASSTTVGDKLQCSECGTLMRSEGLKSHIISKHIGKMLFACSFCDRRFTLAQNARRHLRDRCKEKYTKLSESQGNNMSVYHAQPLTNKTKNSTSARLSEILSDSNKGPVDSQENDNESDTDIFAEDSSQDSDFDVDRSSQENKKSAKRGEAPLENRANLTGTLLTIFDPDQYNCAGLDDTERVGTGSASAENQLSSNDVSAVNAHLQDEKSDDNNFSDCQNTPFQLNVMNNTDYDSSESDSNRESDESDDSQYVEMEMEEILNEVNNGTAYEG